MSTRTDFEYLTSTSYGFSQDGFTFEELDEDGDDLPTERGGDVSRNDIGYFMELAGRYPLLRAAEERTLGMSLWRERVRLLRVLRGSSREPSLDGSPATPSTRRRLARVEKLAREVAEKKASRKGASRKCLRESLLTLDEARSRLVEHNLRLVVWVAKRFRGAASISST
jgi:DNA-directed RNA polymerase sigma subunit (sigma70/sigma32)